MSVRRLRLLVVSHSCATPQNQKLFALAAAQRGWEVTMCVPSGWRDEYGQTLPAALMPGFDARLVHYPVIRNGSVPLHAYRGRLGQLIRDVSPDVVYSHNEAYAASTIQLCWANVRSLGRPFGFYSCQNLNKRYPTPFRQGEQWVYRNSRFFLPITAAVDQVHRDKGYTGPSTIVPLGYNHELFRTTTDTHARHLQAPAGSVLQLVYVGRVVEEKGLLTLAAALGTLKHLDWRLKIAGGGPYEPQVRRALDNAGVADRVSWLGFVDRDAVPQLLESSHVMVLPSETRPNWKEQFGRVILESIACGCPVVGSDSGEIPVLIRETGGGLVAREADPDDLAHQLAALMQEHHKRAAMAASAADYVQRVYQLESIAERFADAIEAAA